MRDCIVESERARERERKRKRENEEEERGEKERGCEIDTALQKRFPRFFRKLKLGDSVGPRAKRGHRRGAFWNLTFAECLPESRIVGKVTL